MFGCARISTHFFFFWAYRYLYKNWNLSFNLTAVWIFIWFLYVCACFVYFSLMFQVLYSSSVLAHSYGHPEINVLSLFLLILHEICLLSFCFSIAIRSAVNWLWWNKTWKERKKELNTATREYILLKTEKKERTNIRLKVLNLLYFLLDSPLRDVVREWR